jgi:hypothetical protein
MKCLSPELTKLAHDKGYGESSHVTWFGRTGAKDWELKPFIIDGDWTFVTKNSVSDFARAAGDCTARSSQRCVYCGNAPTVTADV